MEEFVEKSSSNYKWIMPQKTKREKDSRRQEKKEAVKPLEEKGEADEATWGGDQREKSYYYDDAHGYEIYNPEEDEEAD